MQIRMKVVLWRWQFSILLSKSLVYIIFPFWSVPRWIIRDFGALIWRVVVLALKISKSFWEVRGLKDRMKSDKRQGCVSDCSGKPTSNRARKRMRAEGVAVRSFGNQRWLGAESTAAAIERFGKRWRIIERNLCWKSTADTPKKWQYESQIP
jgi:hypothetical protein